MKVFVFGMHAELNVAAIHEEIPCIFARCKEGAQGPNSIELLRSIIFLKIILNKILIRLNY